MLFDLPSDLSLSILQDWLADLKCLAALDAASAPSVRSDYLGLVAQPAFILPCAIVIDEDKSPVELTYWIGTRMAKFSALESDATMLKQCAKISFLCLRTVWKLKVYSKPGGGDGDNDALDTECFQKLLRLLPQLRVVDMSDFVPTNAGYVTILSASTLPPNEVLLDNSLASCDGISALIAAFGPTLAVVNFGDGRSINTSTLNIIASTCKQIKELAITCLLSSPEDYGTVFASDSFPLLERLDMLCDGPQQIEDSLIITFFHHHPLLTSVDLELPAISPQTCASIIASNPKVTHFSCNGFKFDVISDSKYSKLMFEECDEIPHPSASEMYRESVLHLASSCLYPIRQLECFTPYLNNEDLITVLSALGGDLTTFITDLNGTVDDDDVVQQITLLCPVLDSLFLNAADSMTDLGLNAIANNCKFVTTLALHNGNLLTDFGICHLVCKIGEQLTELLLTNCSLTSTSFVAILSVCSNLTVLKIDEAGIPAGDVQVHLLSSTQNRLPKLERLLVDVDAFEVLVAFVTNPVNAVDKKWRKLLESSDN